MLRLEQDKYPLEQILVHDVVFYVVGVAFDAERQKVQYEVFQLCYPIVLYVLKRNLVRKDRFYEWKSCINTPRMMCPLAVLAMRGANSTPMLFL